MKVLIITYYWPPAGGSGVQRWLKFVKYLQDFDITPVVYTVDSSSYAIEDTILEKDIPKNVEVVRKKILEPNNFTSFLGTRNKKSSAGFLNPKPGVVGKVLRYIRANYFIPDARKFWIKPSVKFLKKYISNKDIDLIITTGPPHSLHLIGLQLKKELSIKWISDFRDPWVDVFYNDTLFSDPQNGEEWKLSSFYNQQSISKEHREYLEELKTAAFIVIHKDSVLYEEYWDQHDTLTVSNSFSIIIPSLSECHVKCKKVI